MVEQVHKNGESIFLSLFYFYILGEQPASIQEDESDSESDSASDFEEGSPNDDTEHIRKRSRLAEGNGDTTETGATDACEDDEDLVSCSSTSTSDDEDWMNEIDDASATSEHSHE